MSGQFQSGKINFKDKRESRIKGCIITDKMFRLNTVDQVVSCSDQGEIEKCISAHHSLLQCSEFISECN